MAENWIGNKKTGYVEPVDVTGGWGPQAAASVPRGVSSPPPTVQKSKRDRDWDVLGDLRKKASDTRARKPDVDDEKYKPSFLRKVAAAAIGGLEGYERAAGRSRTPDMGGVTSQIMRPGYRRDVRAWEDEMTDIEAKMLEVQAERDAKLRERDMQAEEARVKAAELAARAQQMNAQTQRIEALKPPPPPKPTVLSQGQRLVDTASGGQIAENPAAPPKETPLEGAQRKWLDVTAPVEERQRAAQLMQMMRGREPKDPMEKASKFVAIESQAAQARDRINARRAAAIAKFNSDVNSGADEMGIQFGSEEYKTQLENLNKEFERQLEDVETSKQEQVQILQGRFPGSTSASKFVNPY